MGSVFSCIRDPAASIQDIDAAPVEDDGQGRFLFVRRARSIDGWATRVLRDRVTQQLVIVQRLKLLDSQQDPLKPSLSVQRFDDIIKHSMLAHPFVVQLNQVFLREDCVALMLDYAIGVPGELLADYILECGPLPPDSAKTFFWQLVDALSYLHGHGVYLNNSVITHTYVKGEPEERTLKVAIKHPNIDRELYGRPDVHPFICRAPEQLRQLNGPKQKRRKLDSSAIDVWESGVLLCLLLTGTSPFGNPWKERGEINRHLERIVRGSITISAYLQPSPECMDLLSKLLAPDPSRRIKVGQILQHPWLQGVSLPDLESSQSRYRPPPVRQTPDEVKAILLPLVAKKAQEEQDDELPSRGVSMASASRTSRRQQSNSRLPPVS